MRRFRALYLKRRGWYQRDIAEALDVSEETVSRWLARARNDGPEALRERSVTRPVKMELSEPESLRS
jgi:transposase